MPVAPITSADIQKYDKAISEGLIYDDEKVNGFSTERRMKVVAQMSTLPDEHLIAINARKAWRRTARKNQLPPAGDWFHWLVMAGRGFGKSRTGAEQTWWWAWQQPNNYLRVIARTHKDLKKYCFGGPSGLLRVIPPSLIEVYNKSDQTLKLINGSLISGFSAEEPESFRGPQSNKDWLDEFAAWSHLEEAYDNILFGLRIGLNPQAIITTTPRPRELIRNMVKEKDIVITRGKTSDNAANLSAKSLKALQKRYAGTRTGRQELEGELLTDIPGALWTNEIIERSRFNLPDDKKLNISMERIVVGIDPAVSTEEGSAETGIVVAGVSRLGHYYVIADFTIRGSPSQWATQAIRAYKLFRADRIVVERNNGGAMCESTIKNVDKNVPVTTVHASRGKITRAEPVSALWEQKRGHVVGNLTKLEEQMTTYSTLNDRVSPDRMDAMVWAITDLMESQGETASAFEVFNPDAIERGIR